ncbi:MAG: SusF/SusE family outer membrane protein [Bacteroidia bacterium]|nr:SusF/SusE family outer membrane protein [Bacteroidia bacterium]
MYKDIFVFSMPASEYSILTIKNSRRLFQIKPSPCTLIQSKYCKKVNPDDNILILKLIKEGDRLAFRHLFETWFTPLCRFMHLYIPEKTIVEELTLDLFMHIWENRQTLQIQVSLKAYLFQAARNKCLNELRKQKNTVSLDEISGEIIDAGVYSLEQAELQNLIHEAVLALPDLTQLYMVGSATTASWDNAAALPMTMGEEGIFTWTGDLTADGEFKFLNQQGSWNKTINPVDADTYFVEGTEYSLGYRPLEASPNDFKFKVTTAGSYTVSVNLNTMKAVIQLSTGVENENAVDNSKMIVLNGSSVRISNPGSLNIQLAELYDLTGKRLSSVSDFMTDNTVLAENLSKSVYLVKIQIGSKHYSQKIVL